MKILLVTYWGLTNMGGIWTYMKQLADKLNEYGHEVTLMGSRAEDHTLYLLDQGISFDKKTLYNVLLPQLDKDRFPHLHLEHGIFSFELGRYVFEGGAAVLGLEKYDVIHAQDPISAYALRRIMKVRKPLVSSFHGALAYESYFEYKGLEPALTRKEYEKRAIWRYFRRLEGMGVRSSDLILVSSDWIGRLVNRQDAGEAPIRILPYGIDVKQYDAKAALPAPLKFGDGLKVIMYAGRLEYIKGVHVLIAALGILQHSRQDWVCAISGIGSLTEELQAQVLDQGMQGRVFFTGKMDNIPAALTAADIYVQPSLQDTQPFSVTEAQLAGIAPVVAGTAGMPEMVQQGVTGFVVPAEDSMALAVQLEQLLQDDELRLRTGKQARSWAEHNRTLDGMAAGTLKAYHEALSMQHGQSSYPAPRRFNKGEGRIRLPQAFHPADILEHMPPDRPLAHALREGLPQDYCIPDAQMALKE
ncbi:hypothetical protein A3844_21235 [Paenibacillus helianthi]|uniref:Glycosyltransferase family 1 protein n=1 Tax=Paenibacillus helianthi TaxID=1349432 RepID=A0ABX3EIU9_9BACL|nr:glycosyltransferase family 4 protein [Paenibacillus helianthi]OKP83906.1 hypothetical protein A3844_21235 [Paenibacillus helianthi]